MQSKLKESSSTGKSKTVKSRTYQERSVPKFLKKVFYILEENKHSDQISWSADGLAIVIKRPTEFSEKVLPLYFKHNNFASFIRQVFTNPKNCLKFVLLTLAEHVQVQKKEMLSVRPRVLP